MCAFDVNLSHGRMPFFTNVFHILVVLAYMVTATAAGKIYGWRIDHVVDGRKK